MGLVQVTAPASEPITLAEAKLHLREDGTAQNDLITAHIIAARQLAENDTGRSFVSQQWRLTMDDFPRDGSPIRLERPPLVSVQSITYVDSTGVTQTLAASEYVVDVSTLYGEVVLAYGAAWPNVRAGRGAVTVNYTAGYGAAAAVPEAIKAAIKLMVADLYENRESAIVGTIHTDNPVVRALLSAYALPVLA